MINLQPVCFSFLRNQKLSLLNDIDPWFIINCCVYQIDFASMAMFGMNY